MTDPTSPFQEGRLPRERYTISQLCQLFHDEAGRLRFLYVHVDDGTPDADFVGTVTGIGGRLGVTNWSDNELREDIPAEWIRYATADKVTAEAHNYAWLDRFAGEQATLAAHKNQRARHKMKDQTEFLKGTQQACPIPAGSRIEITDLVIEERFWPPTGTRGTVLKLSNASQLRVQLDNGRRITVLVDHDPYRVLTDAETLAESQKHAWYNHDNTGNSKACSVCKLRADRLADSDLWIYTRPEWSQTGGDEPPCEVPNEKPVIPHIPPPSAN